MLVWMMLRGCHDRGFSGEFEVEGHKGGPVHRLEAIAWASLVKETLNLQNTCTEFLSSRCTTPTESALPES